MSKKVTIRGAALANNRRVLSQKQKQQVKRMIVENDEIKKFPYYTTVNPSTTIGFVNLNAINVGDAITRRSGLKVIPRLLDIKYDVTVADATNDVRVVLFRWRPNNGDDLPQAGEILRLLEAPENDPMQSFVFEKSQSKKFKVLYDRTHYLNNVANPREAGRIYIYNKKNNIKLVPMYFDAATGPTDPNKNGLYIMYWSDSSALSHPTMRIKGFLEFTSP